MRRKLSLLLAAVFVFLLAVGISGSCRSAAAAKLKLNAAKKTIYVGEKFLLELEGASGKVKWSSSNKKVATVKDGAVTAQKTGKTTVKAKDAATGKTYKCKITVKKNAISDKKLSLKAGESFGLTLKGNTVAEWESSDESVVTVNNGTVTALKKGKADITATVGSKKYTCKVNVTANAELSGEPVELSMWCMVGGDGAVPATYEQAINDLKTSYPNVTLKVETFEMQEYKDMIRANISAGELPDIFFTWSGSFLGDFVNAGRVYCLDDVLSKYISSNDMPKVMLDNTTYDDKSYGVPLTMNVVVLFANTELLESVGFKEVPATFEELCACCDKLIEKGITPFGCSGEPWCISEYLEPIMEKSIGAKALNKIFSGKASFDNKGIADSVDLFKSMIDMGYFNAADLELSNGEIGEKFMNGEYAFYMNGSWNCGMLANDPEFCSKVAISEFPVINSKNSKTGELIGGPSETLAVSAASPNAKLAAEYAVAMGKLICKYGYLKGDGLPAWKVSYDDSGVNELTRQVSKMCANAKAYVLYGDTAMSANDVAPYLDCLGRLFEDDMDGEKFVNELKNSIR